MPCVGNILDLHTCCGQLLFIVCGRDVHNILQIALIVAFRMRLSCANRAQGLLLKARNLARVGTTKALELQVLTDGVIEQSH